MSFSYGIRKNPSTATAGEAWITSRCLRLTERSVSVDVPSDLNVRPVGRVGSITLCGHAGAHTGVGVCLRFGA